MTKKDILKSIMKDVNQYVIQNGKPHLFVDNFYMREVFTLYAKQHNLVESTLLLLDNNNNEEACVLARSALNNYFLIGYLLNDSDGSKIKEYRIQPLLSNRRELRNIKEALKRPLMKKLENEGKKLPFTIADIDEKIKDIEKRIEDEGYKPNRSLLTIKEIATHSDEKGLELYMTFYAQGSKYEHSDISVLDIYKKQISDDIDKNDAFIMSTDSTNENLGEVVLSIIIQSYLDSLFKIVEKLKNEEQHLLNTLDTESLNNILVKATTFLN